MAVTIAFARDGTLAADVQGAERVDLTAAGRAHRHVRTAAARPDPMPSPPSVRARLAVPHIDHSRAARWTRRPSALGIAAEHRRGRAADAGIGAPSAVTRRSLTPLYARAIDIGAHEVTAGDLRLLDRSMHIGDRRLLEVKRATLRCRTLPLPKTSRANAANQQRNRGKNSDRHRRRVEMAISLQ